MKRADGRSFNQMRPVRITPGFQSFAEGSALIELGMTRVLCSVSVEDRVPGFLRGQGSGWVTAEYSMLPRAGTTRSRRESVEGHVSGRSQEIQRLIGRSMRAVVNLDALGERSFIIDCDVIQADGGTRTAAITGSYVALYQAFTKLAGMGLMPTMPLDSAVAATSVGVFHGNRILDLCYDEDSAADADFNVVMTGKGEFVEVQGTAEGKPFNREAVDELLSLAEKGIRELFDIQQAAIEKIRR